MCVLHPIKVHISNLPSDFPTSISVLDFPGCETKGQHTIPFSKTFYIEQDDFKEVSHFYRLLWYVVPGIMILLCKCDTV